MQPSYTTPGGEERIGHESLTLIITPTPTLNPSPSYTTPGGEERSGKQGIQTAFAVAKETLRLSQKEALSRESLSRRYTDEVTGEEVSVKEGIKAAFAAARCLVFGQNLQFLLAIDICDLGKVEALPCVGSNSIPLRCSTLAI
jgi:hypothetical protein